MYAELGASVIAADLDPQANLSAMFLSERRLEEVWPDGEHPKSILGIFSPILKGIGDIAEPHVEEVAEGLGLVIGDLGLSRFEANLSSAWSNCLDGSEAAFRAESAFHRTILKAAEIRAADIVLMDVGPNLGAINRAAIIATNFVIVPLGPDLFSLQGLRNLGPTLRDWRQQWCDRLERRPAGSNLPLPAGKIEAAGYILMQHAVRSGRPVQAYDRWMARIPDVYRQEMLGDDSATADSDDKEDCLGTLKHYRSLMPMAQDARKPIFHLSSADGALGAHTYAVWDCHDDFEALARSIARRCAIAL